MKDERIKKLEMKVELLLEAQGVQWAGDLTPDEQERSSRVGQMIIDFFPTSYIATGGGILGQKQEDV